MVVMNSCLDGVPSICDPQDGYFFCFLGAVFDDVDLNLLPSATHNQGIF